MPKTHGFHNLQFVHVQLSGQHLGDLVVQLFKVRPAVGVRFGFARVECSGNPRVVVFQSFETSDGEIVVAAANDRLFAKLAKELGHPEWAEDPAFATNAQRVANRATLVPMIADLFAAHPAAHWQPLLEDVGIPSGPINSVSQALADPQAVHRGMRLDAEGTPMVGCPIRIDGERQDAPLPPPALGQHGDLLSEWVDVDALAALRAEGIVG